MLLTVKNQGYTATIETLGAELKSYKNETGKEFVWIPTPTSGPALPRFYSLPSAICAMGKPSLTAKNTKCPSTVLSGI